MSFGKSRTVGLCSLANFINAADRAIMPIAIIPMAREFQWNLRLQGYILSAFPIGYLISQLFTYVFIKRFGTKNVLAFAVFTWSFVTLATPFLASLPILLICSRIVLGFGEGLALPTIFHIFSNYVPMEERSRSFSYLIALGSVGQTIAAVITSHIAWRMMFLSFGLMGFLWTFVWIVTYRDFNHSNGNNGDEEAFISSSSKTGIKSYRWIEFISHWPLWSIYIAHFAMNWSSYIVMIWLPSYLTKVFDADTTTLSFTAYPYVMNCLTGVAAGHLADYLIQNRWTVLSVRRLMTAIGLLGPGLFLLLFISVDSLSLAVIFISISMGLSACNSAGHLSNHADIAPNHAGITFAISNTLATIPGILAGPVTAELVVASHGRWFPVFILASGVNFVGAIIYQSQTNGSGDNVSKDAIADKVQQLINDHKVIVFSKTYCPYCVKAKNILNKYKLNDYKIIELDEIDDGNEYQKILGQITNAKTVPRVFIAGECIGGGDDTERLDRNGDLEKRLKQVHAINENNKN